MFLIVVSRISPMTLFLPAVTSADAGHDAWIAVLLATAAGAVISQIPAVLAARFPKMSLGAYAKQICGRLLGLLVAVIGAAFFFSVAVFRVEEMSLVILSSMFTLTPAWVLALSIVIVVIYCASLGADALGRASELFFTIVVLSFVIGLILLMTGGEVDYMYLTPVLARGFGPVIGAAWVPLLWYATSSSLVLGFGKYCSRPGLLPAAVFKAVLISGVFQLALVANAVATFGPVQAVNQMSPIVSMARTLCIPGFIERLDVLLLSVWAVGIVFDITVTFFVGTAILAEAFGTTPRVTALVVGVPLSVGIVMRQTTIFEIGALLSPSYAMALTLAFHIGLVGTLLATSLLTKKGGPSHGGRSRV